MPRSHRGRICQKMLSSRQFANEYHTANFGGYDNAFEGDPTSEIGNSAAAGVSREHLGRANTRLSRIEWLVF